MPDYDFITTYTGVHFFPTRPDPDGVRIADVAHALSLLCRGNGHVKTFSPWASTVSTAPARLWPETTPAGWPWPACSTTPAKPTSPMSPAPSSSISPSTGHWRTVCWPPSTKNT